MRIISSLALAPFVLLAPVAAAQAQDTGSHDQLLLGAGAIVLPGYEGSDRYRVLPYPVISVNHGRLFVNPQNGAGIKVIDGSGITVGGSITYVPGYRHRDVPTGIDKLSDTAGGRIFATLRSGNWRFNLGATRSFGGTKGTTADATLSYTVPMGRFAIAPSVGTSWADGRYMRRYFDVDASEAVASGLPQYRAGAGFKDVTGGATLSYMVDRHWIATANLGAMRLLGDADDTPLNRRSWNAVAFTGLGYRF